VKVRKVVLRNGRIKLVICGQDYVALQEKTRPVWDRLSRKRLPQGRVS
jgi:hypothetical protein